MFNLKTCQISSPVLAAKRILFPSQFNSNPENLSVSSFPFHLPEEAWTPCRRDSIFTCVLKFLMTNGPPPLLCPGHSARACSMIRRLPGCSSIQTISSKLMSGFENATLRRNAHASMKIFFLASEAGLDFAASFNISRCARNPADTEDEHMFFSLKYCISASVRLNTTSRGSASCC